MCEFSTGAKIKKKQKKENVNTNSDKKKIYKIKKSTGYV
jgi:hypothetical protein